MAITPDFMKNERLARDLVKKEHEYREWLARSGCNPFNPPFPDEWKQDEAARKEREEHKKARRQCLILLS